MPRSIRWTLIGWFGLLLAAVLAAFGGMLYARTKSTLLGGIDAELENRSAALAGALEWEEQDGWELDLSDDYLRGVAEGASFGVWAPDGTLVRSGGDAPPSMPTDASGLRTRGDVREIEVGGAAGAHVILSRPIGVELARLSSLRVSLIGIGLCILALGLGVGSWLARRTLAPIESLAATAGSIQASDLSRRLDEGAAPLELAPLARAFNAALERLEQAFQRQVRFTADASHELRTPLTVLRAQSEIALRKARTPEEYRTALEACRRAAERMSKLTESLLELARADVGQRAASSEPLELDQVVREAAEHLRPLAEAEGLALALSAQPVRVRGDREQLAEVLSNLISNSVRYNRPGGRIEVDCVRENGSAVVRVADTGVGIPQHAIPLVFDRFYRVDGARARARGGAGLGLSIARQVVEVHGGAIDVESRLGEGSRFTVRLPALDS
jgi:two-component system, OmpR family, sensor kinase